MLDQKEEIMLHAINEAKKAFDNQEVPVGSVIYNGETIIAKASNKIESEGPTKHAEMIAIEEAFKFSKDLSNCEIYVTLEPCPMCFWAIRKSGIKKIYFSTYNDKEGFSKYFEETEVFYKSGILEDESKKLLKDFFKGKR